MAAVPVPSALAECVRAFVARGYYLDDIDMEASDHLNWLAADERSRREIEAGRHPLDPLRSPRGAVGRCGVIASRFAEYARVHHGLVAESSEDVYGAHPTPPREYWDYQEASSPHGHVVTLVSGLDGHLWLVDFAAAQYGITGSFPLVAGRPSVDLDAVAASRAPMGGWARQPLPVGPSPSG